MALEGDRHLGFSVRGRRFAWLVEDHHGDGRVALHCKAAPGENTAIVTADPRRYFRPPYLAHRGWVGAWLDVEGIDWEQVEALLVDAYRLASPRSLAAQLDVHVRSQRKHAADDGAGIVVTARRAAASPRRLRT